MRSPFISPDIRSRIVDAIETATARRGEVQFTRCQSQEIVILSETGITRRSRRTACCLFQALQLRYSPP